MVRDIVDKKEELAVAIEEFMVDESNREKLLEVCEGLKEDSEVMGVELFSNVIGEILGSLDELSRKELKQRVLLIRSYF